MEELTLIDLRVENFEKYLQQKIEITFSVSVTMPAEIIEITHLPQNNLGRIPFSVVFRTKQQSEYYQQGIYLVSMPNSEPIELFLVPFGPDKEGMRYEAIIS